MPDGFGTANNTAGDNEPSPSVVSSPPISALPSFAGPAGSGSNDNFNNVVFNSDNSDDELGDVSPLINSKQSSNSSLVQLPSPGCCGRMSDRVTDTAYNVAHKYRLLQRRLNLLDVSYDMELGPVRKDKNGEQLSSIGKNSGSSNSTVPNNREFFVGEKTHFNLEQQDGKFCSNKIQTTKYTFYSFIPKYFVEQFRKAANCFFLLVSLLQIIPGVSPTGRFTTLTPLSIILFLTALKEIYEDICRWKQDKDLNEKKVKVLSRSESPSGKPYWVTTNWDKIRVGNIVQIATSQNHSSELSSEIPADILILATSETDTGTCTITTKNLDGETNLKNKFAVGYTHNQIMFGAANGIGAGINSSGSYSETQITSSLASDANELNNTTATNNQTNSAITPGLLSIADARFIIKCERPHKNMEVFKGQLIDTNATPFVTVTPPPGDDCNSVKKDKDGVENGQVEVHSPCVDIPDQSAFIVPVNLDNLLLRECKLENTEWVIAAVVYTGPEAKISLNKKEPPLKQSSLEKITNVQIYFIFAIMLTVAFVCFAGLLIWDHRNGDETSVYIPDEKYTSVVSNDVLQSLLHYATFFILFNNLVPISLMFTVEMVKLVQAYFINSDPEMCYNLIGARARTSNLNDELGRIKHLFSDKTGTLTQNKMQFKKCFIKETAFDSDAGLTKEFVKHCHSTKSENSTYEQLNEYLIMMAACNCVTPNDKANAGFISSSPDEHALVLGAKSLGYVLKSRGKDGLTVELPDESVIRLKEIHVIPFDSNRKRMSLIFEEVSVDTSLENTIEDSRSSKSASDLAGKKFKIYTKGADATMVALLSTKAERQFNTNALSQINDYSKEGLRTLVFASRIVTADEILNLTQVLEKLSNPNTPSEEKLLLDRDYEDLVKTLESGLDLVGCSAVEDKLQDGVPQCIAALRAADINVWMLTGDKLETAFEIAYSCHLFSSDSAANFKAHKIESKQGDTQMTVLTEMDRISHDIAQHSKTHQHGLIFEGSILKSLDFSPNNEEICSKFFEFTKKFKCVAACRLEPLQKAELVEMTQSLAKGEITLAIGDGANDVPMIQAAHVGIGIQGEEGLQAVLASDYSISQFRFLRRLLFIHGSFSYQRVSRTILYCFYKNITLYLINFWYQFVCGFSGQSVFDKLTLSLYNIVFTSLPLFSLGVLDRPVTEEQMMKNVFLYRTSQLSLKFNAWVFWTWCLNALAHSFFIFIICLLTTKGETVLPDAHATSVLPFGELIYTAVIIVVTLKLVLVTHSFFTLSVVLILSGVVSWFVWFLLSSYVTFTDTTFGFWQNLAPAKYFWFTLLLAVVVALYRDTVYKCLKVHLYPSLEDCVKMGLSPKAAFRRFGKNQPLINFSSIDEDGQVEEESGYHKPKSHPSTNANNNNGLSQQQQPPAFARRLPPLNIPNNGMV